MLDEHHILSLKARFSGPEHADKLIHAVNVGSHNEAIRQVHQTVTGERAVTSAVTRGPQNEELLALLLPQVTEEITLEDPHEWISVTDWVRIHGKESPRSKGWELVGERLYRPKDWSRNKST